MPSLLAQLVLSADDPPSLVETSAALLFSLLHDLDSLPSASPAGSASARAWAWSRVGDRLTTIVMRDSMP